MEKINEKIVMLRQKHNVSQKKLAEFLGVGVPCLSLWENGQRKIGLEYLTKIGEFFNVSIDYLLGVSPIERQDLTEEEKQLVELIKDLDDKQTEELSNYVDYLLSKRK